MNFGIFYERLRDLADKCSAEKFCLQNNNKLSRRSIFFASKQNSNIMLTFEQKILMAQMIFNEKQILFGEFGPELTKVEKQEKWMEILVRLNSVGANIHDYKVSFVFKKSSFVSLFQSKTINTRRYLTLLCDNLKKGMFLQNFFFLTFCFVVLLLGNQPLVS
jgi:hypothetical protein